MRYSIQSLLQTFVLPFALVMLCCVSSPATAQEAGPALFGPDDVIEAGDDDPDVEALGRGPLHEAFAEQVNLDVKPSPIVAKRPPEPINEIPPEIKPDGEHVEWIPGYWAYDDDERNDYIWVSGVWRKVPPGRRWVPGYWAEVEGGYRWVSGTWASADIDEVEVLPPPPESLEQGPNRVAESEDDFWIPGCWTYQGDDYRWRPGYWSAAQENWIWVPERYVWTPSGCLHVTGYWDYPVAVRGYAFAPYCFHRPVYQRPGYAFSPGVVLNVGNVFAHLFVRPSYHHYYFGDYYADRYSRYGYLPWHDYRRRNYCPLLTHYSWYHQRRGVNYVQQLHRWHDYNVRHADYRPNHSLVHLQKQYGRGGVDHPYGKDRQYDLARDLQARQLRGNADRHDEHRNRDMGLNLRDFPKRSDSKLTAVHVEAAQRRALAQSRQQEVRSLIESRVDAGRTVKLQPGDHAHSKLKLPAVTEGSLGRRTVARGDARGNVDRSVIDRSKIGRADVDRADVDRADVKRADADRSNSIFSQQQIQSRIREAQRQAAEARSPSLARPDGRQKPSAPDFESKPIVKSNPTVKSKPETQTSPRPTGRPATSNEIQDRIRDAQRRAAESRAQLDRSSNDGSQKSAAPVLERSPPSVTKPRNTSPANPSNSASQIQARIRQAQEAARARSQAAERARSPAVERAQPRPTPPPSVRSKPSPPPQIQNRSLPSRPPQIQNRSKPSPPPQIQKRSTPSRPPQLHKRSQPPRQQPAPRTPSSRSRSSQSSVSKAQSDRARDRRR